MKRWSSRLRVIFFAQRIISIANRTNRVRCNITKWTIQLHSPALHQWWKVIKGGKWLEALRPVETILRKQLAVSCIEYYWQSTRWKESSLTLRVIQWCFLKSPETSDKSPRKRLLIRWKHYAAPYEVSLFSFSEYIFNANFSCTHHVDHLLNYFAALSVIIGRKPPNKLNTQPFRVPDRVQYQSKRNAVITLLWRWNLNTSTADFIVIQSKSYAWNL